MKLKGKDKILYDAIDEILWIHWDPCGCNEIEDARDEYYSYIPKLLQYLKEDKDYVKISNYLYHTETVNMGGFGDREKDIKVAKMLIAKMTEILGL